MYTAFDTHIPAVAETRAILASFAVRAGMRGDVALAGRRAR